MVAHACHAGCLAGIIVYILGKRKIQGQVVLPVFTPYIYGNNTVHNISNCIDQIVSANNNVIVSSDYLLSNSDKTPSYHAIKKNLNNFRFDINDDPAEKKIYRMQANYGQALKGQWSSPVPVASLIDDITVRYYFTADKGLNVKTQADEGLPMGVMIDIQFTIDGEIRHMQRFMLIPVGGGI